MSIYSAIEYIVGGFITAFQSIYEREIRSKPFLRVVVRGWSVTYAIQRRITRYLLRSRIRMGKAETLSDAWSICANSANGILYQSDAERVYSGSKSGRSAARCTSISTAHIMWKLENYLLNGLISLNRQIRIISRPARIVSLFEEEGQDRSSTPLNTPRNKPKKPRL